HRLFVRPADDYTGKRRAAVEADRVNDGKRTDGARRSSTLGHVEMDSMAGAAGAADVDVARAAGYSLDGTPQQPASCGCRDESIDRLGVRRGKDRAVGVDDGFRHRCFSGEPRFGIADGVNDYSPEACVGDEYRPRQA